MPLTQRLDEFGHVIDKLRRWVGQLNGDIADERRERLTIDERPDERSDRVEPVVLAGVELGQQSTLIESPVFRSWIVTHDCRIGDQFGPPDSWTAKCTRKRSRATPFEEYESGIPNQLIVAGPARRWADVYRVQLNPGMSLVTAGLERKTDNELWRSALLVEKIKHDQRLDETPRGDRPHPQSAMDRHPQLVGRYRSGGTNRSGLECPDLSGQWFPRHQGHPEVGHPDAKDKPGFGDQGERLLL